MTIVVCVDEVYWTKSQILFESLEKNWSYRICVLCVDFKPATEYFGKELYKNIEFAICERNDLKSYVKGWPSNRPGYFCSESGEFLDYFKFDPNELVIHLDADMIMQRELSKNELLVLEHIEQNEIAMTPSAWPRVTLREEIYKIKPRRGYEKINLDYPGVLGAQYLHCCGMVIARAETYKRMRDLYLSGIDKMVANFDHHAASQWIFNYITNNNFNVINLQSDFHNALWFIDTSANEKNNKLYTNDREVLFNHTKFLKIYSYENIS